MDVPRQLQGNAAVACANSLLTISRARAGSEEDLHHKHMHAVMIMRAKLPRAIDRCTSCHS